jgi:hypothetical protein
MIAYLLLFVPVVARGYYRALTFRSIQNESRLLISPVLGNWPTKRSSDIQQAFLTIASARVHGDQRNRSAFLSFATVDFRMRLPRLPAMTVSGLTRAFFAMARIGKEQ